MTIIQLGRAFCFDLARSFLLDCVSWGLGVDGSGAAGEESIPSWRWFSRLRLENRAAHDRLQNLPEPISPLCGASARTISDFQRAWRIGAESPAGERGDLPVRIAAKLANPVGRRHIGNATNDV